MLQLIWSVLLFLSVTIKQMCLSMGPSLVLSLPSQTANTQYSRARRSYTLIYVESYFTLTLHSTLDSTLLELVNRESLRSLVSVLAKCRHCRFSELNWLKASLAIACYALSVGCYKSGYSSSLRNNRIRSIISFCCQQVSDWNINNKYLQKMKNNINK